MAIGQCMICEKNITVYFDVCKQCEREYGLHVSKRLWPEWARDLLAMHRAEQRQEADVYDNETGHTAQYDILCYGERNTR